MLQLVLEKSGVASPKAQESQENLFPVESSLLRTQSLKARTISKRRALDQSDLFPTPTVSFSLPSVSGVTGTCIGSL